MKRIHSFLFLALVVCAAAIVGQAAEDRNAIVRADRDTFLGTGFWVYNDLERGISEAKSTGKPMLVVFRCVP